MSYLMGWGDRFESHYYVGISADAIIGALKETFPGLRALTGSQGQRQAALEIPGSTGIVDTSVMSGVNERSHIITMESGVITLKDQLNKYMYRGGEMSKLSFFAFMLDTYDSKAEPVDGTTGIQLGTGDTIQRSLGRTRNQ